MIFVTGRRFDYEVKSGSEIIPNGTIIGPKSVYLTIPFRRKLESEKIKQIKTETQRILQLIQKKDLYSKKAIDYFVIGTKLNKWPRESFLNFFKAIELISDRFQHELKQWFKEKIPDLSDDELKHLSTTKRKIKTACEILNIKVVDKTVNKIVNIRHSFDVAHPKIETAFKDEFVDLCMELTRKMIIAYMNY